MRYLRILPLAVAAVALTGCAGVLFEPGPAPQPVPTPVAVPCGEEIPPPPAYSTRAERQAADDGRYLTIITRDLVLARTDAERLRALLEACIRP